VSFYDIDIIYALIDEDSSGKIVFKEFLLTAVNPLDVLTRERIAKAFKLMDSSNDGSLSVFEIKKAMVPNKDIKQEDWRLVLDLKENEGLDVLLTA